MIEPDVQISALMNRYRLACGEPELSSSFMPGLWERIETKRKRTLRFERVARSLVAGAVALSLAMGVSLSVLKSQNSSFVSASFVEQLASYNVSSNGTFFEPVRLDLSGSDGTEAPRRR